MSVEDILKQFVSILEEIFSKRRDNYNKQLLIILMVTSVLATVFVAGCTENVKNTSSPSPTESPATTKMKTIELTSSALTAGELIPSTFTCTGKNDSPPLSFGAAPEGTKSLAVICEDQDAPSGTFIHWILYNIPPSTTSLPQGIARNQVFPDGSAHGLNDFGKTEYSGPCPPPGKPHRYFFRLYALDALLHPTAPVTGKSIGAAMQGHILGQGELMGTFRR